MANTAEAGSSSGNFQEVDLEQLVHLRAKNALWRSWSIEGLSEAAGEEAVSAGAKAKDGRQPSVKSAPKAWEVFYERFLVDVGDSSLAMELSRRHHGAQDMMATGGGGTNVGRRRSIDAPAMSPERSGGTEEEAAVRGGQLFGHLAGRGGGNSTGSGGYGSADDSEMFFPEGMSREDSGGWSELAFGLELSG
ncbi:unnamed protein product, partial [Ectocarpus fasciculatus]